MNLCTAPRDAHNDLGPLIMAFDEFVCALLIVGYPVWSHQLETLHVKQLGVLTAGAGSFTEPNDGGWNLTSNEFKLGKPYLQYSNVRMTNGQSFVGNLIATVTATNFKVEAFSADTGLTPQYTTSCTKAGNGYDCLDTAGASPNFVNAVKAA